MALCLADRLGSTEVIHLLALVLIVSSDGFQARTKWHECAHQPEPEYGGNPKWPAEGNHRQRLDEQSDRDSVITGDADWFVVLSVFWRLWRWGRR